jgi:hypothetical protein
MITGTLKNKVDKLSSSLSLSVNMDMTAATRTLADRYKNRFELCAENLGMTLADFGELHVDQQVSHICANMSLKNSVFGVRRVDFSNRYAEGMQLYYLTPNYGATSGNTNYGKCRVIISVNSLSAFGCVALKYDSLVHYYNNDNELDENMLHGDLIPYSKVNLLLSEKYTNQISSLDIDDLELAIEKDQNPMEIMTTARISSSNVTEVVLGYDDYKYIAIDLNMKRARGGTLEPRESEELYRFHRLQREVRRCGVKIRFV